MTTSSWNSDVPALALRATWRRIVDEHGLDVPQLLLAAVEIERLQAELHDLRRALVFWNHDHQTSDMLRDRIAEVIERNADAIDQPYNMADAVLSAMRGWIDRLDQTLYDVIPQGDWGIVLEGDDE